VIDMKRLTCLLTLCGLLPASAPAADEPTTPHALTFNLGVTTDYIFRGISQSQHDPALSAGMDYSHASGLYAGAWASTQKWVDEAGPYKDGSDFELDVYGGYKGTAGDIGYDIGFIRYAYDGDRNAATVGFVTPDTSELYLGLSWKMLSLKYSHAVSKHFMGWTNGRDSTYLELNATHDLGNGWGLLGHIGHQKVENNSIASYTDWKVGVTKDVGFGLVTLAYSDTDADGAVAYRWNGEDVGKGVLALSFSKSF